jgi:hypothetical protein
MAGAAAVLVGEVRRVEPAGGWQSLVSLGVALIAGGFGLGVAFAVVTAAGLRGGGRPADRESWPGGLGVAEPGVAPSVPAAADWADEQGRPEGFVWAGDPAPAAEPAGRADWDEPDEAPPVAVSGPDNTKAEDWLSHLRGSGPGPVQEARQAAPPEPFAAPSAAAPPEPFAARPAAAPPEPFAPPSAAAPPEPFAPPPLAAPPEPFAAPSFAAPSFAAPPAAPGKASYGPPVPADYADEGWRLDGADWVHDHQGAPEVHHPTAGRRHDTGQWRAFGLDQEPPAGP